MWWIMAGSPQDIAALKKRIADLKKLLHSGVGEVQHGDKRTRFNTVDQVKEAIRDAQNDLREMEGQRRRSRIVLPYADRGV